MYEAIVTLVTSETAPNGTTYPITKVYRLEFDSEDKFVAGLQDMQRYELNELATQLTS